MLEARVLVDCADDFLRVEAVLLADDVDHQDVEVRNVLEEEVKRRGLRTPRRVDLTRNLRN